MATPATWLLMISLAHSGQQKIVEMADKAACLSAGAALAQWPAGESFHLDGTDPMPYAICTGPDGKFELGFPLFKWQKAPDPDVTIVP